MGRSRGALVLILAVAALTWATRPGRAQLLPSQDLQSAIQRRAKRVTQGEREAAADRLAAARALVARRSKQVGELAAQNMPMPGGTPHYFGPEPNWAFSPPLRKFVDTLPGLTATGENNLGQYLPVANPDTITYPGSDYYEIGLVQYTEQMHSDLPPTTLRGYVQLNYGTDPGTNQNTVAPTPVHYLGPLIVAQKDRPVRINLTNLLPTGGGGDLFIPVDTTVMGAGMGADGSMYTQNRATIHLHGGRSPWISDGTVHQWTTPAGEVTSYPKGVSAQNVPDMPDPGPGSLTFFWTNQQSARMMFYHDHAWGITRLNVYVGEAAGYVLTDQTEQDLTASGLVPADQIPLIIQDKTFVDADTIGATDPTWNWGTMPGMPMTGDLWYPHVYMTAQNPYDISGVNPYGRWHYGPWFWPPTTNITYGPVPNPYYDPVNAPWEPPYMPGVPHPSMPGESFLDTPVVNGTAFPTLTVEPKAYRFRILNAANDRFWNLQLYEADPSVITVDGRTDTEVRMVPAVQTPGFPASWPTDGREGGVPDPATAGPPFIQIGSEGGFLPAPVVIPNQPIAWNADPTTFNFGNVSDHALLLGPAERADVVVDFSQYPGKTLILYNDAPAAFPALDPRYDYYTGAPDLTDTGGHPGPQVGFGPNTRTIMQIKVANATPAPGFDLLALDAAFTPTAPAEGVFVRSQEPIIVGQTAYDPTYNTTFPTTWPTWGYVNIQDTSMTFKTVAGDTLTVPLEPKAIQDEMGEAFDPEYGRMSGKLGLELPFTAAGRQTFVLQNYVDPPTEVITESLAPGPPLAGDGTQIWKITHNGVDTHPIHFHLFDVQLINRVGWDGAIRLPDPNELGWKETVRISPLEDTIVALRPVAPKQPFGLPDSIRAFNPAMPLGSAMGFTNIDPLTGQPIVPPVTNQLANFGWEYMWHCHILSHEEMDMMRPVVFNVARQLPTAPVLTAARAGDTVDLTWTDATPWDGSGPLATLGDPTNEIGFLIERATIGNDGSIGAYAQIGSALANATSYADTTAGSVLTYSYRVVAYNAAGNAASDPVTVLGSAASAPAAPSNLAAIAIGPQQVDLSWTDNSTNEAGFTILRATDAAFTLGLTQFMVGANETGYSDTTVLPITTYYYQVMAFNVYGSSAWSNTATATTPNWVPAAPSNLAATVVGPQQVDLTWTDNSNNETGFNIQRATDAGFTLGLTTFTVGADVTMYSDATALSDMTYYYHVQATNAVGPSAWSNTAAVTMPPLAPSNLRATPSAAGVAPISVALRWGDNSTTETAFLVERDSGTGFAEVARVAANIVDWTDTTVLPNATYAYRVRATNAGGNSAYTNTATATTPPNTPPAAPSNLRIVAIGNNYLTIGWNDNSTNETGFEIQRSSTAGGPWTTVATVPTNTTRYRDNGLGRRTTRYYQIRSVNGFGTSGWIGPVSGTTR